MPSLVLILLLCLCVHSCTARHLGITDKETGTRVHLLHKHVEKAELHKTSTPSRLKPSISVGLRTRENFIAEHDHERQPYESWGGANTMKRKDFKTLEKEDTAGETQVTEPTGNEILASSLLEGLQQATKLVGWKRQERSLLAFTPNDTEETVNSKENEVVEDIVVMDYAQPRRKPPIHNKDP